MLPESKGNIVVVISGGLDSTILSYLAVDTYGSDRVRLLSFNYGQKQVAELTKARTTARKLGVDHHVLDITFLAQFLGNVSANIGGTDIEMPTIQDVLAEAQPVTYVPYRNMLMTSMAFSYAESVEADKVMLGLNTTDSYGYWDTTQLFVKAMNAVSTLNREHDIQLVAPFNNIDKCEEILIGNKLNVPFADTLTCYNPTDIEGEIISCGKCPSCSERIMNFSQAGIKDSNRYAIDIPWDTLIQKNKRY